MNGPHDDTTFRRQRIAHWDRVAGQPRISLFGRTYHRRLHQIYRFLIPPGQRVLELGCGNGRLLAAAAAVVRPGGAMVMIEPWRNRWSELVYRGLHHEPFDPHAGWELPAGGPLSNANGALPWIVFARDRGRFEDEFQQWEIASIEPLMPLRYLVSGGLAWRCPVPTWSYGLWRRLDELLVRSTAAGLFARIVLRRVNVP